MPPDNERARLRAIMYEPSKVWLASTQNGVRYLTDQYVLLDVTDAQVTASLKDGPYQLMATGEWRAEARDSVPPPDVSAWLEIVSAADWRPAKPTEWSVAEHPGKAMLWAVESHSLPGDPLGDVVGMDPALLGEPTWSAIKRHHPEVEVDWAPNKGAGTFRFSQTYHMDPEGECAEGECDCPEIVFAYAAGIRVPEGQERVAQVIVEEVPVAA